MSLFDRFVLVWIALAVFTLLAWLMAPKADPVAPVIERPVKQERVIWV